MSDHTVTNADVEALAAKLDGMGDQFSEAERAALAAVFSLAGASLASMGDDVEGFALGGGGLPSFEMNVGGTNGILIGLNQGFGGGGVGGIQHKGMIDFTIKLGDGSVRPIGGTANKI